MKRKNNIIALSIFSVLFFITVTANIFQHERATVSEEENRTLAKFPEFSIENLVNGKFLSGIDIFISDTFIFRTELIDFSRKITALWSANTYLGSDENDIIFIPSNKPVDTVELESPLDLIDKNEVEAKNSENQEIFDKQQEELIPGESEGSKNISPSDNQSETEQDNSNENSSEHEQDDSNTESSIVEKDEPNNNDPQDEPESSEQKIEEPIPNENLTDIEKPLGIGEPEFLSSGEIIYNGAVISIPYLVKNVAQYYADVISYYKYLFPEARVSTLCAPLSSAMVDEPSLKKKITDQNKMINTINGYLSEDINGINCFDDIYSHRNEYIYFKSDHHWTSRGAYYAYVSFAESLGLIPTPLNKFTEVMMNSKWQGSAYSMTGDERVKEFSDEVYAYIPTRKHTMTTYNSNGEINKYNSSILTNYASYSGFIDGDNAYTIINVPENPKDMTILVFKDSFGNAFVPYLVEHYSTIIVVDPRHIYFDVYQHLKNYPITDILFVNNLYNPNVVSYSKNLMRAVGK